MEDLPLNSMESDTYLKFEGGPALILHILGLFFFLMHVLTSSKIQEGRTLPQR